VWVLVNGDWSCPFRKASSRVADVVYCFTQCPNAWTMCRYGWIEHEAIYLDSAVGTLLS
jgi:hypothetical protein